MSELKIDPSQPVNAELSRLAVLLLDGAIADLEVEPGRGIDPEGVHDARKALKRLRALVRLGRGALGTEAAQAENHAYRDLAHHLSSRRDADAMVETVDRLQTAADHEDADLAASLATLHHRLAEAATIGGQDDAEAVGAVRAGLLHARRRAEEWSGTGMGGPKATGWHLLEPGFARQYRQGRDAFHALGEDPTDEQLHDWRKRVKDHWYHLEFLDEAWPKVLNATAKEVHHLADHLGDDHDLAELENQRGDGLSRVVRELIDVERARLQTEGRHLGRRVFAEPPKRLGQRFGAWWPHA